MARAMKDSGIEWIGEIPQEWEVRKLKHYYKLLTGFTPDTKRQDYYDDENGLDWVTISDMEDGKTITSTKKKISQLYIDTFHPTIVPKGSLLYSFKLSVGQTSYAGKDIYTNEAIASFPMAECENTHFLRYSSILIVENAEVNIYNARIMNQERINNASVVYPPLYEQTRIAAFLDRKCAEIDAVVAETQKTIEEYKALKQSIITEAVTKGIRKNRKMKDSGVEWIGEIPEEWEVGRLQFLINHIESGTSVNAGQQAASNTEIGVLKTSCVSKNRFLPEENKAVNKDEYDRVSCPVCANTLIVSRMNTPELVGATGYVQENYENLYLPDRLWQIHFNRGVVVKYYYYLLISKCMRNYYSSLAVGTSSSMQNISQDQFFHASCPMASSTELEDIVLYLDKKVAEIDQLIINKETLLTELESYKKSLIYEYVTGKKEVPVCP